MSTRDEEIAYLRELLYKTEDEVARLKAELTQLREATTAEYLDATAKWQSEKQSLEDALDKQRALVQQLERSIEELNAEMQRRLDEASSGSSKELDEQRAAHAAALEALKRQHAQQLLEETSRLKKAHATELQDCKDRLQAEITALKEQLKQLELQLESGSSGLKEKLREIDELKERLKNREEELVEAQKAWKDGLKRESDLKQEVERLERELERNRQEAEAQKRQHEMELQNLRSRLEGDASQSGQRHREELERLRKELEAKLEAKERDAAQERARLERELKEVIGMVDSMVTDLKKQMDEEVKHKLPISRFFDRATSVIPKVQIGFIEGFVLPTFDLIAQIAPEVEEEALPLLNVTKGQYNSVLAEQARRAGRLEQAELLSQDGGKGKGKGRSKMNKSATASLRKSMSSRLLPAATQGTGTNRRASVMQMLGMGKKGASASKEAPKPAAGQAQP